MITLYTGVPGSGKTYKMVHDLSLFVEKNPDILIISNIRNLKLAHTDFESYLDELFPKLKRVQQVELFFTFEHQQKINQLFGGPVMYVLDECQLYFPRRTSMPHTEGYLQRHRHLGHYLYLASQSSRLINSSFVPLIEIEYHAGRRTISFFGEIHYKEKSPQSNQIIRSIRLRPKKNIFKLYQSFEAGEIQKPKPSLAKFFFLPILLSPFFYFFYEKNLKVPQKTETVQSASFSGGSSPSSSQGEYAAIASERDKLKSQISELQFKLEDSRRVASNYKAIIDAKERVFLPVIEMDGRKMTVDPDTQAIVELAKVKHLVTCVNGGLSCYYDRAPVEAVKIANVDYPFQGNGSFISYPATSPRSSPPPSKKGGAGSFITEDLFIESAKNERP